MESPKITIAQALRILATEVDKPMRVAQLCDLINERWSIRFAADSVRSYLKNDYAHLGWLRINQSQYLPLRVALEGIQFRCWPNQQHIASGSIPLILLYPFVSRVEDSITCIYDEEKKTLAVISLRDDVDSYRVVKLQKWFQKRHFAPGDSIIVKIHYQQIGVRLEQHLYFTHERAADFRAQAVINQERELIEAAVEQYRKLGRNQITPSDQIVLSAIAGKPWRTSYPGRPWQYLLHADGRLALISDGLLVQSTGLQVSSGGALHQPATINSDTTAQWSQPPVDSKPTIPSSASASRKATVSSPADQRAKILAEITALQQEIQRSREQDRQSGIWNGMLTSRSREADREEEANQEDEFLMDDLDDLVNYFFFNWQYAVLREADRISARLNEVLPSEVKQRLAKAEPEEVEGILSSQLPYLFQKAPDLFPRIDLPTSSLPKSLDTSFNQQQNLEEVGFEISDDWDDDFWDTELDEDDIEDEMEDDRYFQLIDQSMTLINLYIDYLQETGKKLSTARNYARPPRLYADFLASFYERSLDQGDYATLDEFLFYYYPYHYAYSSGSEVRELCIALRRFYAFLKERGLIDSDQFAEAMWQRRFQAAKLANLYRQLVDKYADQTDLVEQLFAPYFYKH
ncbi:hypothetical protein [Chloroflexus aurantiacus]